MSARGEKKNHREPPLPQSMRVMATPGVCRWCGKNAVTPRKTWHDECVDAYKLIAWPAITRRATFTKDRGRCKKCRCAVGHLSDRENWWCHFRGGAHLIKPYDAREVLYEKRRAIWRRHRSWLGKILQRDNWPHWQADHITPLIEADPNDMFFWTLGNLRVLCNTCHKSETAALAARRAGERKSKVAEHRLAGHLELFPA